MSIETLEHHFAAVNDPSCSGKVKHRLVKVLIIAVDAVIACAESWDDIALYGRSNWPGSGCYWNLQTAFPCMTRFGACSC